VLALILTLSLATPPGCEGARIAAELAALMQARRYADAHQIALTAGIFCPDPDRLRWRLGDAVALYLLDDRPGAEQLAASVAAGPSPALAVRANVLRGWMAWGAHDHRALGAAITRLPPEPRGRLCLALQADEPAPPQGCPLTAPDEAVASALARYRTARVTRRPWLAGLLSAVLPGSGQVYAGSWQGAAVAFVLNSVSIAATVELARDQLYFASALTGTAASVFYVGSILNAADLAAHRNDVASAAPREELERLLIPERFDPAAP
jgi:hypothetical protein